MKKNEQTNLSRSKWIQWAALPTLLVGTYRAAADLDTAFTFQGVLRDSNGLPAAGQHALTFSIWAEDRGGANPIWQDTAAGRPRMGPADGLVTEEVEAACGVFAGEPRWLQIDVDGTPQLPRIKLASTP
jgi:hypothetical protein